MQSKATVTQPKQQRKPEEDPLSEGEEPHKTKENSAEEALSFFAASGTVSVPGLKQKPRIANARGRESARKPAKAVPKATKAAVRAGNDDRDDGCGDDVATTTQRWRGPGEDGGAT